MVWQAACACSARLLATTVPLVHAIALCADGSSALLPGRLALMLGLSRLDVWYAVVHGCLAPCRLPRGGAAAGSAALQGRAGLRDVPNAPCRLAVRNGRLAAMEAISDARSPPKIKVNRLLESAKVRGRCTLRSLLRGLEGCEAAGCWALLVVEYRGDSGARWRARRWSNVLADAGCRRLLGRPASAPMGVRYCRRRSMPSRRLRRCCRQRSRRTVGSAVSSPARAKPGSLGPCLACSARPTRQSGAGEAARRAVTALCLLQATRRGRAGPVGTRRPAAAPGCERP